jgi:DNA replication protein DnaC
MCGVQKRHRKTIDLLGHDQWRSKYQTLCDLLGTGFLAALLGPRGTGKTQMAAELIRRYIFNADAPSCRYVRATDIFMAIRCAYRNDGPSERDQISGFTRPQLLVIEESHVRGGSDWEDRLLTDLIDRRYGAMKDTLLLSNQNEQDFRASIGYSVYSRLTETGGVIMCDWESFRTPGTGATR